MLLYKASYLCQLVKPCFLKPCFQTLIDENGFFKTILFAQLVKFAPSFTRVDKSWQKLDKPPTCTSSVLFLKIGPLEYIDTILTLYTCPLYGLYLISQYIGQSESVSQVEDVHSIERCAGLCADEDGCVAVTHHPEFNNCWLKNSHSEKTRRTGMGLGAGIFSVVEVTHEQKLYS